VCFQYPYRDVGRHCTYESRYAASFTVARLFSHEVTDMYSNALCGVSEGALPRMELFKMKFPVGVRSCCESSEFHLLK
jgi:hypothetical protein